MELNPEPVVMFTASLWPLKEDSSSPKKKRKLDDVGFELKWIVVAASEFGRFFVKADVRRRQIKRDKKKNLQN